MVLRLAKAAFVHIISLQKSSVVNLPFKISQSVRQEAVLQGMQTVKWPLSTCMAVGETCLGVFSQQFFARAVKQSISELKVIVDSTASNTRALPRPVKRMDLPLGQTTVKVNL